MYVDNKCIKFQTDIRYFRNMILLTLFIVLVVLSSTSRSMHNEWLLLCRPAAN